MEEAQVIDQPKIYQACGIVSGVLELVEGQYSNLLVRAKNYSVTVSRGVQEKHQPGQQQNFEVYPAVIEGKLGFSLRVITKRAMQEPGIILKGCWERQEEEPRLVIHRNRWTPCTGITILPLTWKEAPVADGQYWEIEARLEGDKLEVMEAIGPFEPPRKYQKRVKKDFSNAKSDLPRPILKGDRGRKSDEPRPILKSNIPREIKSELPPPILKSAKVIEPPESQPIAKSTSEPITLNASQAIKKTTIAAKAVEICELTVSSEIEAIAYAPKELIEPEEPEASLVVVEAVTPKAKKAGSKSSASKKSSISPETAEPKKTKEKVKSSRSKKSMSLVADRLFLGKQLPPGK